MASPTKPHPDLWRDGITIEEAIELNIPSYTYENLLKKIGKVPDSINVEPEKIDGQPVYTDKCISEILVRIAIEKGKIRQVNVDDRGMPSYHPNDILNIHKVIVDEGTHWYFENEHDIEPIENVYEESKSMRRWLKVPWLNLNQFTALMIGSSPDYESEQWEREGTYYFESRLRFKRVIDNLVKVGKISIKNDKPYAENYPIYSSKELVFWMNEIGFEMPDYLLSLLDKNNEKTGLDSDICNEILNTEHPFFSPELSVAIKCWQALFVDGLYKGKIVAPKVQYKIWLSRNTLDLSDAAKERIATVVNPEVLKEGGATRTK